MTDKEQIIIDGINVTDCNYIIAYDPPKEQGTWGSAIHKGACKIYSKDCKYNSNCYFKQLAHSEARVKELEEKLNAQFAEMEEKLTAEADYADNDYDCYGCCGCCRKYVDLVDTIEYKVKEILKRLS